MSESQSSNTDFVLLLGRIDGKMDIVLSNQTNHDNRIRALEKSRWAFAGATTVISVLFSTAVAVVSAWPFK